MKVYCFRTTKKSPHGDFMESANDSIRLGSTPLAGIISNNPELSSWTWTARESSPSDLGVDPNLEPFAAHAELMIALFLTILIFWFLPARPVLAVEVGGADVAGTYVIADTGVVDGDVVVNTPSGFARAIIAYDNNIFGVYSEKPTVVFRVADTGAKPIVRSGITTVNVTTANGEIKAGDYLTSSTAAGKGQKADRSGYVLGVALAGFSGAGQGKIPVAIKVEYAELTTARSANRLLEALGASFFANVKDPERFALIIRYILAGLLLLICFGLGFWTFSRVLPKGVEAIGRNPLAKNTIYFSMVLNVGLIAIVGILGIVGALLILRL